MKIIRILYIAGIVFIVIGSLMLLFTRQGEEIMGCYGLGGAYLLYRVLQTIE